jgi:hypothetical protein
MRPNAPLTTLRPDLAGSLQEIEVQAQLMGLVGLQIAPAVEVNLAADSYGIIPFEEMLKTSDTKRSGSGEYNRFTQKFGTLSYSTEEHGIERVISDRDAKKYAAYIDAEMAAVSTCRQIVLYNHEKRVIDLVNAISNTTAAGTAWTTLSTTPVNIIRTAMLAIHSRTGLVPNVGVISWNRFQYLKDNDQVLDRLRSLGAVNVQKANITAQQLAAAFDLENLIVAGSVQNTAKEGQAKVVASLWPDDKFLVARVCRTSSIEEPGAFRTFHWGEDGSVIGGLVESYYSNEARGNVVRCRMDTDEKTQMADAAQVITGI